MKLNFINNPVINSLLHSLDGFLALVKQDLQVAGANDTGMQYLKLGDVQEILGLRIGEAMKCIHAGGSEQSCGSGEICRECGLLASITACLASENADERKFSLAARDAGKEKKLLFKIRSSPLTIDSKRFVLLFIQDVTCQERLIAAERRIFHNINNAVTGLVGTTQLIAQSSGKFDEKVKELLQISATLSSRLINETAIQRTIVRSEAFFNPSQYDAVSVDEIFGRIREAFSTTLISERKSIRFKTQLDKPVIKTNLDFLMIVLNHMVKNALEETGKGGDVKVWTDLANNRIIFNVWNSKPVSEEAAKKIFQRNCNTKPGMGRGYGTYTMKLFGEEVLGGAVDFTSSDEGTVFRISLPASGY